MFDTTGGDLAALKAKARKLAAIERRKQEPFSNLRAKLTLRLGAPVHSPSASPHGTPGSGSMSERNRAFAERFTYVTMSSRVALFLRYHILKISF